MITPKNVFTRPQKRTFITLIPIAALLLLASWIVYKYVNPAPPSHLVITTSDGEGDYQAFAKQYQAILKEDGIDLEIRTSSGAAENLKRLTDPKSDVDVGFVQDGLGSPDTAPELSSLGSLYYEPIWVFYRAAPGEISRFSQFKGKRLAVGRDGGGTRTLALSLLAASGLDEENTRFLSLGWRAAADALQKGEVDAAIFLSTDDEPIIKELMADPKLRLMSLDQAEAITRQIPFLHHLVLPHGALDLKANLPPQDTHLVSPTATLLVRDSVHSALVYLLLKAASQVHDDPGIFEKKNEFPTDKAYQFPLADEAKSFYKSGTPFWRRYMPFWLAMLIERFLLIIIPTMALILPMIKLVPRYYNWRVRTRIYSRYGELKYLETQIKPGASEQSHLNSLEQLDSIEDRVNHMKVPLDFSDHIYVLREHIDFVRKRLRRDLAPKTPSP